MLVGFMLSSTMSSVLADTDLEIGGIAVVANTGGDAVMVREGAGYHFAVLTTAAEGTVLTVTDGPFEGEDGALWYEVNADGTIGYVYADFLSLPENAPANPGGGGGSRPASDGDGYYLTISGTGGDGARMRDGADLDAAIILVIPEGAGVEVLGSPDYGDGYAWYPVAYAGSVGWVAGIFLGDGSAAVQSATTESTPGGGGPVFAPGTHVQVSGTGGENLRIRETYGLDGAIYGSAPAGAVLQVLHGPEYDGGGNSWYAVNYDGLSGYAIADYLSWTDESPSSRRSNAPAAPAPAAESAPAPKSAPAEEEADEPASNAGRGQAIVNIAMRYLGYPYVWAGSSPSGFDCSGFTMYVMNLALGVNIGHLVDGQFGAGVAVSAKALEPGDLVFFQNTYKAGLSHVGLYIGGGQMVHAGSERTGVVVSNIWDSYWGPKYYGARRIH
jgi:cell wall-associated NlpC family hydrolase